MDKQNRPGIGIAVIVIKENKVLLGKRKNAHGEGTWAFPGGHLEKYESLGDCALREIEEETGLIVKMIDENTAAATNDFFKDEDKHYVTLFLRARYISGTPEVLEPNKCERWDWYSWNNLPEPLFIPIQNLIKQEYNPFEQL